MTKFSIGEIVWVRSGGITLGQGKIEKIRTNGLGLGSIEYLISGRSIKSRWYLERDISK